MRQVVQVSIVGTPRLFTYGWDFEPPATMPLEVGDRVELPPNIVQEEGSSGTVAALGSNYHGPMKTIVRKIAERRAVDDDDLWAGTEGF